MTGRDVFLLQALLNRGIPSTMSLTTDGVFGASTSQALAFFQRGRALNATGVLDASSAQTLLSCCLHDGYVDDGRPASAYTEFGLKLKYKMLIPVHADRNKETVATLFDAQNRVLHRFRCRTHGQNVSGTGEALNDLSSSGATPTGLALMDLNTREFPTRSYGPFPVNRFVRGVKGNMGLTWHKPASVRDAALVRTEHGDEVVRASSSTALSFISDVRDGILQHSFDVPGWKPGMRMPDSHGCVHVGLDDAKIIVQSLLALGVQVRNNTNGALPYPYEPQGIVSVEQIE